MTLPRTVVDPIERHELALELGMTVAELMHGRGAPTPLRELTVEWPAFWAYRQREAERNETKQTQRTLG